MRLSNFNKAVIALILANILWGASPPIFKWSFSNVHIFTLAFLRYFIPVLLMLLLFPTQLGIKKRDFPIIFLAALFNITLGIIFYFVGIQYTESINATIIGAAGPAFLILGSIIFLGDRPSRKMLLGNMFGLTGVLLIILQPFLQKSPSLSLWGNLLLLLSTLASVIGTILVKEVVLKYKPITLTFWTFAIGAITFYPLFLYETATYGLLTNLNVHGITGIVYGSLGASFFAWLLFYYGFEFVTASETTIFSYLQILASVLIAAPLLGEYPSVFFVLGTLLIFFGMYFAENHKSHPHVAHLHKK